MYFGETLYNEATQIELAHATRRAAEAWRLRNLKAKEPKFLTAVLTTVLRLFVW